MDEKLWQNLLHKKCPKCDERLVQFKDKGIMYSCPAEGCGFIISQKAMVEIFTDEHHIMRQFLSPHERMMLNNALAHMELSK